MSKKPENPHAFPLPEDDYSSPQHGMQLRDWFAGQALTGIIANEDGMGGQWKLAAEHAYKSADAMLAEREKTS